MAFDVSKFLALTVLIAGTGAACSGTGDKDDETNGGGNAGSSTSGKAGQGNDAAGADAGGAAAGGEGGAKTVAGGAGAGGEALGGGNAGGAGGAGGAAEFGECLGSLIVGGAGGAGPDVEPSLEGLCEDLYDSCPSAEAPVVGYLVCQGVAYKATAGVAVAVADCITALSDADKCDSAKVTACYTDLQGRGCPNPESAAACAAMKARTDCDAIDLAKCEDIADLIHADSFEAFKECMDPSIEGYYDETFTGTCVERLDTCSGLQLL